MDEQKIFFKSKGTTIERIFCWQQETHLNHKDTSRLTVSGHKNKCHANSKDKKTEVNI